MIPTIEMTPIQQAYEEGFLEAAAIVAEVLAGKTERLSELPNPCRRLLAEKVGVPCPPPMPQF